MARFTALSTLRTMLKAETGKSLTVGTQMDTALNTLLSDTQKWLAGEYDWPFLFDRWDVTTVAGTRYYNVPTTSVIKGATTYINFERPVRAMIRWNRIWMHVEYGISLNEFNTFDPDLGQPIDPVQRWQLAGDSGTPLVSRFEIWPLPATAQTLRFEGQRTLAALSSDSDTADLDDLLLVLFCASEILAKEGSPQAPLVLSKASQRLARLRGAYPARTRAYVLGTGAGGVPTRVVPLKVVAVA